MEFHFRSGASLHLQCFTASSGGPFITVGHRSRSVRERNRFEIVVRKSFGPDGAFTLLPPKEARALVEMARVSVDEMRAEDQADHVELDAYHTGYSKAAFEFTAGA